MVCLKWWFGNGREGIGKRIFGLVGEIVLVDYYYWIWCGYVSWVVFNVYWYVEWRVLVCMVGYVLLCFWLC